MLLRTHTTVAPWHIVRADGKRLARQETLMRTSTIEVGELVSTLSAAGVERQLSTLPGVHHADVNYVAGSATVHYDESLTTLEAIRQRVTDCGYHCRGELVPTHVCDPAGHEAAADVHTGHAAQADHGSRQGHSVRPPTTRPT